jgi:hypothetical protein
VGTTTNGLPYPEGSDRVADGDNAIRALAEAVDKKAVYGVDTGFISLASAGFVVASSNWASLSGTCRRRNGFVAIAGSIVNKVAIGGGNITNLSMIVVPAGWRPYLNSPLSSMSAGPGHFSYASGGGTGTAGTIYLSATAASISANQTLTFGGLWMMGP